MTQLVFHHKHHHLPPASEKVLPVQLYGLSGQRRGDISVIGNPAIDRIRRLGVQLPAKVMDFLSVALAVLQQILSFSVKVPRMVGPANCRYDSPFMNHPDGLV